MKLFAVCSLLSLACFSLSADVWYNGDNNNVTGFSALSGTPNGSGNVETMEFEDFQWTSSLNAGTFHSQMFSFTSFTQVKWEIREGVTSAQNNAGSLVATGISNANLVSLGLWVPAASYTLFDVRGTIGSVPLTQDGIYYLGLAIVVPNSTFRGGVATTSGTNSLGFGSSLTNHNSFGISSDSSTFHLNNLNLSMGLGTVPEPASLVALSLGVLALLRRRK